MFRHNLLVIYRNFLRNKGSFFINLIGLSTGLACALLIWLWVTDEFTVDKFHKNDSRLFQVMANHHLAEGIETSKSTPGPLAEALVKEMPEVAYATTGVYYDDKNTLSVGDTRINARARYVGKDFFHVFSYELTQGLKGQVLADPASVVISEDLAMKLFKTTANIIGKPIRFQNERNFVVSGVFKGTPPNSTDQFDFLLSFEVYKEIASWVLEWGNSGPSTYVVLKEGANVQQFNDKIRNFIKKRVSNSNLTLFVTPFSSNYLYGRFENGVQAGGRIEYIRIFSLIALFIVLIACINFMNLSTANASQRVKEVGVKKAVGASRRSLILQFLSESVILSFLSLLLAVVLTIMILPQFNEITGKQISLRVDEDLLTAALSITLVTGLLSGSYPALYLSGFNPAIVLKGKFMSAVSELIVRKGLVVFQFALSVILIVSVLVIHSQLKFIQTQNLGYNKDNLIYFESLGRVAENTPAFLSEVKNIPGVVNASSTGYEIGSVSCTYDVVWEGKNPADMTCFQQIAVGHDMLNMMEIKMAEGRTFSRDFSTDSSKVILNETAAKIMGLSNPVGKMIRLWGDNVEILGVAKDFYLESLHENVKPLMFRLSPADTWVVMVKLQGGRESETIAKLKEVYERFNPGFVFDYKFMDAVYRAQYAAEQRLSVLSKYFAGLAILLSCLGLLGLAIFTTERRFKEIGIRKVLGSGNAQIFWLLSGEFTKIVTIAILIAIPVSYFITRNWLGNFALRISLQWWYFIIAGIIALGVAWLTVSLQAMKAARINPLQCLRNE